MHLDINDILADRWPWWTYVLYWVPSSSFSETVWIDW